MPGKDPKEPEDIRDNDLDDAAGGKILEGMHQGQVFKRVEIDLTSTLKVPPGNLATKSGKT